MSSPSLSDSPGTFKVVAGAFLENRPKFKFLQNSSSFIFYRPSNLLNQRTAQVGFYIILLCLGQGPQRWFQKISKDREVNAAAGITCLWFDAILIYAHVVSMNMINLPQNDNRM